MQLRNCWTFFIAVPERGNDGSLKRGKFFDLSGMVFFSANFDFLVRQVGLFNSPTLALFFAGVYFYFFLVGHFCLPC